MVQIEDLVSVSTIIPLPGLIPLLARNIHWLGVIQVQLSPLWQILERIESPFVKVWLRA